MTKDEAIDLADHLLARGGVTPAKYAEAKGITISGRPAVRLLNGKEAAEYLGMSESGFHAEVRDSLRPVYVGRAKIPRYDIADLDALIAAGKPA